MMAVNVKQLNDATIIAVGQSKADRLRARMEMKQRLLAKAAIRVPDDSPWIALKVMTGREHAVEKVLSDAGVEVCVPTRKGPEKRRRGKTIPSSVLPVLIGYVMVRCAISNEALAGLLAVDNVLNIVGGYGAPDLTSAENIRKFIAKASEGEFDWERPAGLFKRGMEVQIKDGLFSGHRANIISCRSDGKGDAVIELPLFPGVSSMIIPLANLERL